MLRPVLPRWVGCPGRGTGTPYDTGRPRPRRTAGLWRRRQGRQCWQKPQYACRFRGPLPYPCTGSEAPVLPQGRGRALRGSHVPRGWGPEQPSRRLRRRPGVRVRRCLRAPFPSRQRREGRVPEQGWPYGLLCYPVLSQLSLIHISEPTRLGMISYAVFCLKKKKKKNKNPSNKVAKKRKKSTQVNKRIKD